MNIWGWKQRVLIGAVLFELDLATAAAAAGPPALHWNKTFAGLGDEEAQCVERSTEPGL